MPKLLNRILQKSIHLGATTSVNMTRTPVMATLILAILSIIIELVAIVVFAKENVMLYADGGWFVFALATGNPWILKWKAIAARFTPYALTVWPVLKISHLFHLVPTQIALANCLLFYGCQAGLTLWSYWLAWRTEPRLLVFPVVQTILFSLQGWGFPSELLLAPGILWVILLTAVKNSGPNAVFIAGFAALVFTHELALPAALVAAGLALYQQWQSTGRNPRFWTGLALMIAIIVAHFWVRAHGGGDASDKVAIYVLDPRRVLASPLLVALALGALLLQFPMKANRPALLAWSGAGFAVIMVLGFVTSLNFDAPRYGARSLIALGMLVLAILFVFAVRNYRVDPTNRSDQAVKPDHEEFGLAKWLFISLGVQAGAIGVFVHDWMLASQAETAVPAPASVSPSVMDIAKARQGWTPAQRDASIRLQVEWSVPYRQFVLTNGKMPQVILYDANRWYKEAGCLEPSLVFGPESRFNPNDFSVWTNFTCTQAKPKKLNSLYNKFA